MESTLHRQLKEIYCGSTGNQEVRVGEFWIDAVVRGRLIEIQRASLGAIRSKIKRLLESHRVTVVKPLAVRTFIERQDEQNGPIVSSRYSPLRKTLLNVFEELVHFGDVFPHPGLKLEIVLVEVSERRITHRKRRFNGANFKVLDRSLNAIIAKTAFQSAGDLAALLPESLPPIFDTAELANCAEIPRWLSQKMAYTLRKIGALEIVGKRKNSLAYRLNQKVARKRKPFVA